MGASDDVLSIGSTFPRVMVGGSGTVLLLFLINAVFRGAGDAAIAMRVLWFANIINIDAGPVPDLRPRPVSRDGRHGRGRRHDDRPRLRRALPALSPDAARRAPARRRAGTCASTAGRCGRSCASRGTATFQNFIATASWMGIVRIISGFGSAAVAGNTIGIRIILFALLPSFGVSNAAATLVGQNLGAGKPDRAEAAAWRAGLYNTICLGAMSLVLPDLRALADRHLHERPGGRRPTASAACASSRSASRSPATAWC